MIDTHSGKVNASPTKSFFVSMLTRDIKLEDAILDLLDNCVDGAIRSGKTKSPTPYRGFKAEIKFDAESFSISDNCGGIPAKEHSYAFRMGRPQADAIKVPGSVGVYGIGMKRAIFKIGMHCNISTRDANARYNIEITRKWMENEDEWEIPVVRRQAGDEDSADTTITVSDLHGGISKMFDANESGEYFSSTLKTTISTHYAYIIDKGFEVTINGHIVDPKAIKILFNEHDQGDGAITPYVLQGAIDEVEVYLAVGLTGKIPSRREIDREQKATMRSSADAGWTVVCNDRCCSLLRPIRADRLGRG